MSCTRSIYWPGRGPLWCDVRNGRSVSVISQSPLYSSKYERFTAVYAFGGKENGTNKNPSLSWESLKKAMGGFRKELTVQDMLRERSRGIDGDGGDGNSRGGGEYDSGGTEDEGFAGTLDEILQVILAVLGVIFLASTSIFLSLVTKGSPKNTQVINHECKTKNQEMTTLSHLILLKFWLGMTVLCGSFPIEVLP